MCGLIIFIFSNLFLTKDGENFLSKQELLHYITQAQACVIIRLTTDQDKYDHIISKTFSDNHSLDKRCTHCDDLIIQWYLLLLS